MRRSDLIRRLRRVEPFPHPRADLEQVTTPIEAAAELLEAAQGYGDLEGRSVADLGCGTGLLSIGAALYGARTVLGVDIDGDALRRAAKWELSAGLPCSFVQANVSGFCARADTVVMNPPFGAQRKHADRAFWDCAISTAGRRVYAFALAEARTFIVKRAVASGARIDETRPITWNLPPTFPHHRKRGVPLRVDLWVLRPRERS